MNGTTAPEVIGDIARTARDAGGRALIVGGVCPRCHPHGASERLSAQCSRQRRVIDKVDIEVFGIAEERLPSLLAPFGRVEAVGNSFPVYKLSVRGRQRR